MPEDADDVVHEAVARIELLVSDVGRVVAVLADEQHAVDVEFAAAEREGLADAGDCPDAPAPGKAVADVGVVFLLDEEGSDVARRFMVRVVDPPSFEEARDEVVAVRSHVVGGRQRCDSLAPVPGRERERGPGRK